MATQTTAYDSIPYDSHPFPQSWPARLAAVAQLFDHDAPDPAEARVLELGCATGGNLIALAQVHPRASFVGVDASARQISAGWKNVDAMRLKNVQLKHMDIAEISDQLGEFDYMICHGVFSWVPAAVQDKILEVCKRNLAPNGIAYISYNTYPGWHIRGIVRDMMLYRGMQFTDPATRLAQAKSLVEFVAQSSRAEGSPYKRMLQNELEILGRSADYYLHHDHLEENNHPIYFHEFARRLGVNGLQYLGEAEFSTMVSTNFAPEVARTLNELGAHDILQMEQYMDFVRCRYFRQTLVCHSAIRLNRRIEPRVVKDLWIASAAMPVDAEPRLAPSQAETFRSPRGHAVTCGSPLTKLALRKLAAEWPKPMPFRALFEHARAETLKGGFTVDDTGGDDYFAGEVLTCMAAGVLEWHRAQTAYTTQVDARPEASALARAQASAGLTVTNLRGEGVTLDELHRQLLIRLDGRHQVGQLIDALTALVEKGELELRRDGDSALVKDPAEMRTLLEPALAQALRNLARQALLLGRASSA